MALFRHLVWFLVLAVVLLVVAALSANNVLYDAEAVACEDEQHPDNGLTPQEIGDAVRLASSATSA